MERVNQKDESSDGEPPSDGSLFWSMRDSRL